MSVSSNESEVVQSHSSVPSATISSAPESHIPPSSSSTISIAFAKQNARNYLVILTLAWLYVLSSHRAEVQSRVIEYTTSRVSLPATNERSCPGVIAFHLPRVIGTQKWAWLRAILARSTGDPHGLSLWTHNLPAIFPSLMERGSKG